MSRMSLPPTPLPSTALTPAPQNGELPAPLQQWGPPIDPSQGQAAEEKKTPWHRYIAALIRFRWLIATCLLMGAAGGFVVTRRIAPEYEAHATIWIADEGRGSGGGSGGPISSGELLQTAAWVDLFKAYRVVQPVVVKLGLYLHYNAQKDSDFFPHFALADVYQPGDFVLIVDATGRRYTLTTKKGTVLEHGVAGDSIGRNLGMRWAPPPAAFHLARKVPFSVSSLSDASNGLAARATLVLPDMSNLVRISLDSWNANEASSTLNAWLDQFIAVAEELKKRKNTQLTQTVGNQLNIARDRLTKAEAALQNFEQTNIQQSTAVAMAPASPGMQAMGGDPTVTAYLSLKIQHDNLSRDIQSVTGILADMKAGKATPDALLAVPSLMVGADNLRASIAEHNAKDQALRELRRTYTDAFKDVQDAKKALDALDTQSIPLLAQQALKRLVAQDNIYTQQLSESQRVVQNVPARTIDLMRLQREVGSASELFTSLSKSFEDSKLAEASAIPDVQILDRADPPQAPSRNTAPRTLLMAIFGGLGAGIGLALLLDRLDHRFRYPEQATDELGLPIIGTVPSLPTAKQRKADPEIGAQVVEAFRTIRLHIGELFPPGEPIMFTMTSPGAGEGKSLIASNLAMSFAEGGRRTLLVDGDIRRGQLHDTFGLRQAPGLLDFLLNQASLDEVLQDTDYERLTLVTCGTRRHRGPELLQSSALNNFIASVRPFYDTIIVDSPPLGAGIDPFALAKATGSLIVVLRVGRSDRNMAQARLETMDRYVRVRQLGSILNDVRAAGAYRYYSYLYGYRLDDGELRAQIPSQVGGLIGKE